MYICHINAGVKTWELLNSACEKVSYIPILKTSYIPFLTGKNIHFRLMSYISLQISLNKMHDLQVFSIQYWKTQNCESNTKKWSWYNMGFVLLGHPKFRKIFKYITTPLFEYQEKRRKIYGHLCEIAKFQTSWTAEHFE